MNIEEQEMAQKVIADLQMTYLKALHLHVDYPAALSPDRLVLPYQALTIIDKLGRVIAVAKGKQEINAFGLNTINIAEITHKAMHLIHDRNAQESFLKICGYMQLTMENNKEFVLCRYDTGEDPGDNIPGEELTALMTEEGEKVFRKKVDEECDQERSMVSDIQAGRLFPL